MFKGHQSFPSSLTQCESFLCWHPSEKVESKLGSENSRKKALCGALERKCCALPVSAGKSFQLHFLSRKAFQAFHQHRQAGRDSWKGKFRYKILLEHHEHATVVIGRRENSTASSKSSRPPSELKVFVFPEWSVTECFENLFSLITKWSWCDGKSRSWGRGVERFFRLRKMLEITWRNCADDE